MGVPTSPKHETMLRLLSPATTRSAAPLYLTAVRFAKAKDKPVKVKNKIGGVVKRPAKDSEKGKTDTKLDLVLRCLQPSTQPINDPRTVEDLQAWEELAKMYSRQKIQQHHAIQGQLARMMKIKYSALAELPPDLQILALTPDMSTFPLNRQVFTDSPPIPSFKGFTKESQ
eukprot:c26803_g1_i1.p1 GENE.c26803_g1_i1~~c26803_g1_i1.p1  ORF type:complete len:171 (+),score=22.21 c26803_g1_i1:1-513(+)